MKKITLITAFIFSCLLLHTCYTYGQEQVKYYGRMYEVVTTKDDVQHHRYFILDDDSNRVYLSKLDGWEKPTDNGDGTATYKKEVYDIQVGSRGGRYIITKSGDKRYIPKLIN